MDQSKQNNPTCFEGSQCITCGYDLRALEIDSACPECGTAIELSMRGDRLSLSDPAWVAKLAKGQSLLVLGLKIFLLAVVVGLVTFFIIGFAIPLVLSALSGKTIPGWILTTLFTIVVAGLFIGIIIATIGCVLVTTQDPRESLSESSISNRNVAQKAIYASYAVLAIEFVCSFVLDLFSASNAFVEVYVAIMLILIGVLYTVSLVATLRWLMNLAARIPDHDLRKRTLESSRFFYWAIPVFIIINIIVPISRTTPTGGVPVSSLNAKFMLFMLLSFASVIFTFAILIRFNKLYLILREYRKAFRKCATEAMTVSTSNS